MYVYIYYTFLNLSECNHILGPWGSTLEVLETMKKMADPPKAFSLKDQYVKSIRQARLAAGKEPSEDGDDETPPPAPVPETDADGMSLGVEVGSQEKAGEKEKPAWNYSSVRLGFLNKLKADGIPFPKRKELWDESAEKRDFLGSVDLRELKRRKFVSKNATENPWAPKADT